MQQVQFHLNPQLMTKLWKRIQKWWSILNQTQNHPHTLKHWGGKMFPSSFSLGKTEGGKSTKFMFNKLSLSEQGWKMKLIKQIKHPTLQSTYRPTWTIINVSIMTMQTIIFVSMYQLWQHTFYINSINYKNVNHYL